MGVNGSFRWCVAKDGVVHQNSNCFPDTIMSNAGIFRSKELPPLTSTAMLGQAKRMEDGVGYGGCKGIYTRKPHSIIGGIENAMNFVERKIV